MHPHYYPACPAVAYMARHGQVGSLACWLSRLLPRRLRVACVMAKFNPGPDFTASNVTDGTKFQALPSGTFVMQQANNNRGFSGYNVPRMKPANNGSFQTMDLLITSLDARFEQLGNQAEWNAFAAANTDQWSLCANCEPDKSGKKLFRQVNFNRSQVGLPVETNTAVLGPFCQVTADNIVADQGGTGAPLQAIWDGSGSGGAYYVQASNGSKLMNPILLWNTAFINVLIPGNSTLWQWVKANVKVLDGAIDLQLCFWTATGMPGISDISELEWNS